MEYQQERFDNIRKEFSDVSKLEYKGLGGQENSITVNVFTSSEINDRISVLIEKLKAIDPDQDYRKIEDLHFTIKGINLVDDDFDKNILDEYAKKIRSVTKTIKPFNISIKGINNFHNVMIAQVFSPDNILYDLHNKLYKVLPGARPEFDGKNYTPHVSLMYFVNKPTKIFERIENFKDVDLGEMLVNKIDLMIWSHKSGKKEIFESFELLG